MKASTIAALAALSAMALSQPAAAASLVNAGFETGDLTGWTLSGPVEASALTPDFYEVVNFTAPEGDYFAELNAEAADVYTTLSQSFTIENASWVSFQAAFIARDDNVLNDDAYVRVFSQSTEQYVLQIAVSDLFDFGYTDWTGFKVRLDAPGAYTFEAGVRNNGGDSDPYYSSQLLLDDVAVTAVPEPGAWALMILGFGALGATLRRRRAAAFA